MKYSLPNRPLGRAGLVVLSLLTTHAAAAQDAKPAEKAAAQPTGAAPAAAPRQPRPLKLGGPGIEQERSFKPISSGKWTGPRLTDGQPDVQGHWSNTIANHNNFTDPQGGIINDPNPNRVAKGPREERAPSRVSDPADGQVPFQPWALAKVKDFQAHFHDPVQPQYIEPLARCAPAGIPKSLYWHGYQISQYPGYVLFQFNSGTRIIHLDGKPHLPDNIKLWNGDSRGHWEGNTLVVDVTNQNGKALFGRSGEFISENGHIEERYIFSNEERDRYIYQATLTDPTVYTRPFTVTVPARRWSAKDQPNGWHFEVEPANYLGKDTLKEPILDHYERVCTENNGGFGLVAEESAKK
ncbi:hypothetical protein A1507_07800 [Methylomonas koyamae]|uniref:Uncharacterized protein n=1 Tax=Methylomonas koyamae TaxID=702114 RepID=A0A177NPP4_9GAMM|nr:hypothetical protein [Methylomonas koyamae]OAI19179.1 hypothetical protein A1507_07800 [Methylomonas koyamae]